MSPNWTGCSTSRSAVHGRPVPDPGWGRSHWMWTRRSVRPTGLKSKVPASVTPVGVAITHSWRRLPAAKRAWVCCRAPDPRSCRSEPHGQAFGSVTRVFRSWSRAQDAAAIAAWSADAPIETNDTRRLQQELSESGQPGRSHSGLGRGAILVDEPTEHVVASNVAERRGSRGHFADRCRHLESKATVRAMLVVMSDVVAKDCFEVVTAENERPVEALFSYGPYPPFRDRVRARRSDGRPDHLDAFGDEHLVEAGGELRVAISDQEPERPSVLGEISCEVAGNLGDEGPGRMIGDPEDVHDSTLELDDEQRIELGELDGVH